MAGATGPAEAPAAGLAPTPADAPVHLLRRRVHRAASGGRRMLSLSGHSDADARRLSRHGFATAGDPLEELHAAAADRDRDHFGRLRPADPDGFARAWLAAAHHTDEVDRALCAAAWSG